MEEAKFFKESIYELYWSSRSSWTVERVVEYGPPAAQSRMLLQTSSQIPSAFACFRIGWLDSRDFLAPLHYASHLYPTDTIIAIGTHNASSIVILDPYCVKLCMCIINRYRREMLAYLFFKKKKRNSHCWCCTHCIWRISRIIRMSARAR